MRMAGASESLPDCAISRIETTMRSFELPQKTVRWRNTVSLGAARKQLRPPHPRPLGVGRVRDKRTAKLFPRCRLTSIRQEHLPDVDHAETAGAGLSPDSFESRHVLGDAKSAF